VIIRPSVLLEVRILRTLILLIACATCSLIGTEAQDLAPRAYVVAPTHFNAVTFTYSYSSGGVELNGIVPSPDASGQLHTQIVTYFHTLNFFGRSANVSASLPYGISDTHGTLFSSETNAHRSGLFAPIFRFSVNLLGGPAMDTPKFRKWRQKNILGVSIRVVPPLGQYDPTKLINLGANRWSFKAELGYSRRLGRWLVDAYGGAWFFTTNSDYFSRNQYFPGTNKQSQQPMGSFESHLSYDVTPRLWASLDGNFWYGGRTTRNGVENPVTLQKNSRIGGTVSFPVPRTKRQSLKFSCSSGAYVHFGGDFTTVALAWQYSWLGRPN